MTNVKNDYVIPMVVLTVICLVISAALAFTNDITYPIIQAASQERAEIARREVLPQADSFTLIEVQAELPETVTEVYKADNSTGYVFMLKTKGYGGNIEMICGINSDGTISDCKTLSHSETAGIGAKVDGADFRGQFAGKDASLSGVSAITGATISSSAYIGAIEDAFTAYEIVKEAQ